MSRCRVVLWLVVLAYGGVNGVRSDAVPVEYVYEVTARLSARAPMLNPNKRTKTLFAWGECIAIESPKTARKVSALTGEPRRAPFFTGNTDPFHRVARRPWSSSQPPR